MNRTRPVALASKQPWVAVDPPEVPYDRHP